MGWMGRLLAAVVWVLAGTVPLLSLAGPAEDGASRPAEVQQLQRLVLDAADNRGAAFAIVDKRRARIHVFDGTGQWRGTSAVLIGQTPGDRSMPGVGERTQVGAVRLEERTTPAGRFVSEPGRNIQGEEVVWVDYEAAFAIHRLRGGRSQRDRAARLASDSPHDKRVSLGCVVVPVPFYVGVVQKLLGQRRGVVYVLPEDGSPEGLLVRGRRGKAADIV
jgi:hypothetical protein